MAVFGNPQSMTLERAYLQGERARFLKSYLFGSTKFKEIKYVFIGREIVGRV